MDITFVVGVIISILLTYLGIWYAAKTKQRVELSLIDRNWIPLITTYKSPFESLELLNYKLPFDSNQYYYRGTLINTGNTDIHKHIILKPLKISFTDDIKIINFRLIQDNPELDLTLKQIKKDIILEWDILKPFEKFSFELIIESSKSNPIYLLKEKMKLEPRIAELKGVNRWNSSDLKSLKTKLWDLLPTYICIFSLLALSFLGLYKGIKSFYNETGTISYSTVSKKFKNPVEIEYYNPDSIKLVSELGEEIVAKTKINDKIQIVPEIKIKKDNYGLVIISLILLIFLLIVFFPIIRNNFRDNRLKLILKSLE